MQYRLKDTDRVVDAIQIRRHIYDSLDVGLDRCPTDLFGWWLINSVTKEQFFIRDVDFKLIYEKVEI